MSSSFGPVQRGRPRFGECRYCWDENWTRAHGFYFEWRQRMVGPVCGHRLKCPKQTAKPSRHNRANAFLRQERAGDYWYRRAQQPDYVGEFGERRIGFGLEGLHKLSSDEAEALVAASRAKSRPAKPPRCNSEHAPTDSREDLSPM